MNTSNTFRSHLMQQFVLHARNQSRTPPIALSGWLRNNNNQNDDNDVTVNDSDYHTNINNNNDYPIANTSRMMSAMDNGNNNNTADVATMSSSTSPTTRILPPQSQHHRVIPRPRMVPSTSSSSTPQQPPPPHSQRQLQSRLLSTHDKNNSDRMNSHHNNDIVTALSSISVSSQVMMDTVQEISNQPQRFNHNRLTNVVPPPELATSAPLLWSSPPRDHLDHHHHHHHHRHHTPSELALAVQTIMSTRHTTNHFRHAAPATKDADTYQTSPTTANGPSPTSQTTTTTAISSASRQSSSKLQWYSKYDYEMAIVRAVRVGYTAPNHKRTEPYVFRRILKPETIERLANIAANVYYYQQMSKLRKEKMTATTTTENQPECLDESYKIKHIIEGMEKKRDKWRNIPAFLVTLLESPSTAITKAQGVVSTTRNHDVNDSAIEASNVILPNVSTTSSTSSASTHVESTTTTTEDDEQDHHSDPYAEELMYRPLPFQPIFTEQDCEDYASACAATQNVLLSLHSEQMATKWVTGPIIRTPAFYDLLQLPLGHSHPESDSRRSRQQQQQENGSMRSATTPQHRVVALLMIGQAAVTEMDDAMTVSQEHAAMDYFHQLQQQQRRRIPKRRSFQDWLQDL